MRYVWPVIALIIACGIQGNLPQSMAILGAMPDLVLVVLIAYSLAQDPEFGATLGFVAGLIEGSAVGISLGGFIVTRTITGFIAGFVSTRLFSENSIVPVISSVWLTAVCEGMLILEYPRQPLPAAMRLLVGECIQNAIFTLVLYVFLKYLASRRKMRLVNARI